MINNSKRSLTRRQRYSKKKDVAINIPLSIATISFDYDENLAFLIRSAACYGVKNIYVIGKVPPRSFLNSKSGSLYDYVSIRSFSRPTDFLSFCEDEGYNIVSSEITDNSYSLHSYSFDTESKTVIVIGNETSGVPMDILMRSDCVEIPMSGSGYCLNASQAGTVMISEYCRQYLPECIK